MGHRRSAMFIDFDNFFSGLLSSDPKAALELAERPSAWIHRLATHDAHDVRRWLVLRCYMNPSGNIAHPLRPGERLYFSKFRPFFTQAGVEVVDCPSLTREAKNGADIRIVIDVMTALQHDTCYDEFVLASSDADFTPLLQVLRSDYETSETPINCARLASRIHADLGEVVTRTRWFGGGTFRKAVERIGLPNLNFSQHHFWDSTRHLTPEPVQPGPSYLPEASDRQLSDHVVKVDLNQPMSEIRATLSRYPVKTRVSLTGTVVVARDIAHAKGNWASRSPGEHFSTLFEVPVPGAPTLVWTGPLMSLPSAALCSVACSNRPPWRGFLLPRTRNKTWPTGWQSTRRAPGLSTECSDDRSSARPSALRRSLATLSLAQYELLTGWSRTVSEGSGMVN